MAFRETKDESYHSLSILRGVHVKISERYKAPVKVTLPVGWQPSDPSELLGYRYDFSHEETAIKLAENEQLLKEQLEIENLEKLMQYQVTDETSLPLQEQEDVPHEVIQNQEFTNCDSSNKVISNSDFALPAKTEDEILLPCIVQTTTATSTLSTEVKNMIDIEEFEGTNQNPFELVELQTLNVLDELRSVLEPTQQKARKIIKSKQPSVDDGKDIDLSIFNTVPIEHVASSSFSDMICNTLVDTSSMSNVETFNKLQSSCNKGTLTWTTFDEVTQYSQTTNPFQPNPVNINATNIPQQPSKMIHFQPHASRTRKPLQSVDVVQGFIQPSADSTLSQMGSLTRTKSLPNLQDQTTNDYENVELISGPKNSMEGLHSVSFNKSSEELRTDEKENIPLERINNIMKQFQFQRFGNQQENSVAQSSAATHGFGNEYTSVTVVATSAIQSHTDTYPLNSNQSFLFQDNHRPIVTHEDFCLSENSLSNSITSTTKGNMKRIGTEKNPAFALGPDTYLSNSSQVSYRPPYANMNSLTQNHSSIPTTGIENNQGLSNFQTHQQPKNYFPLIYASPFNLPPDNNTPLPGPMLIQSKPSSYINDNSINISMNNKPANSTYENFRFSHPQSNSQISRGHFPNDAMPLHERAHAINSFGSASANTSGMNYSTAQQMPGVPMDSSLITSSGSSTFPVASHPTNQTLQSKNSWLPDETNSLSTSDRNFALQLHAMGFELPLVSRVVKRLGKDEKEVLDFLCLVQELKEKGNNADNAELALIYHKNDSQKAVDYIKMVSMFEELGFQSQEIHAALKETSCDQNKALDVLTR